MKLGKTIFWQFLQEYFIKQSCSLSKSIENLAYWNFLINIYTFKNLVDCWRWSNFEQKHNTSEKFKNSPVHLQIRTSREAPAKSKRVTFVSKRTKFSFSNRNANFLAKVTRKSVIKPLIIIRWPCGESYGDNEGRELECRSDAFCGLMYSSKNITNGKSRFKVISLKVNKRLVCLQSGSCMLKRRCHKAAFWLVVECNMMTPWIVFEWFVVEWELNCIWTSICTPVALFLRVSPLFRPLRKQAYCDRIKIR